MSLEVAPTKSEPKLATSKLRLPIPDPATPASPAFASTAKAGDGPNFCTFLKKSTESSSIPIKFPNTLTGVPKTPGTLFIFLAKSLMPPNRLA